MASKRDDEEMNLAEIAQRARADLEMLTGRRVESMSGAARNDGRWRLSFEVLELERIPDSTSLLGTYDVTMSADGELVEYERLGRYYRNRADEEI